MLFSDIYFKNLTKILEIKLKSIESHYVHDGVCMEVLYLGLLHMGPQ